MRIETEEIKIYSVEDLKLPENKEIKEKALNKWRETNLEDDMWHDFILEDLTEMLHDVGFEDSKIYYSGFWSQGDGACFDCSTFNLEQLLTHTSLTDIEKKRILKVKDYISITINRTWCATHYSHYNCRDLNACFEVYDKDYSRIIALVGKLEKELEDLRENKCHEIYRSLGKEWDAQQEDDYIMETFEANDYEFLESGRIY